MIKKRLVGLLSHAKKYIAYNVIWQWIALLAQILAVFTIASLLEEMLYMAGAQEKALFTGRMADCAGLFLAVMLVRFLCEKMAARASFRASADVKRILREKIYEKLLRLGASYKEQVPTSEVVQVSTEGVEQLETYFGRYLPQLFYSLLAPVTLFAVLSFVSLKSSVILLLCVPLIPISIVAVQKIAKKLLSKYWGIYTGLGDSFLENLQGLTTLKIYQADGKKAEEMDEEAQHFRRITMKVLTMQLNSTSVMDIVAYGGAAVGMIMAVREFMYGRLTFAGTLCIILLASEFFIPLRLLGSFFHIAMNGMAASDKIFALLDLPEPEDGRETLTDTDLFRENQNPADSGKHLTGLDMVLENVCFSYEEGAEVLKNVSLKIPAGSFVCLAGESGCGKSTIAGLLTGKNRHFTGRIRIGGKDIRDIREASLIEHITLVRHNSYLFKGTVEENLRMAKADASREEMEAALRKVNLLEFLKTRQGLKTYLSERAVNLSGGQRQRLAIARALLKDTPVYIFDEATSNIDAESEDMIMQVIRTLAEEKTVLLISHRLYNVVECDRIYMLSEGEIAEQGTFASLLQEKGLFAGLYESQRELEEYAREVQAG